MKLVELAICLSFLALPAGASEPAKLKRYEKQIKQSLIKSIEKNRNSLPARDAIGPKVVLLNHNGNNDSPSENPNQPSEPNDPSNPNNPSVPPGHVHKPIKYTMGKFKLVRSFVDASNADFEFKDETICEGGIAIPVYDTRGAGKDEYFDNNTTLSCNGMLDHQFYRFFISASILNFNLDVFVENSPMDLKGYIAGVFATPYLSGPWDGTSNFDAFTSAATADLSTKSLILFVDKPNILQICSYPPLEPIDPNPTEPAPPIVPQPIMSSISLYQKSLVPSESPPICDGMQNKDGLTLAIELSE